MSKFGKRSCERGAPSSKLAVVAVTVLCGGLLVGNPVTFADTAPPPGCAVPRGYDCATPGFERPLKLAEAKALSVRETVVYLYGPGIQDARLVANIVRKGRKDVAAIPAIAVPGRGVPKDAFYVLIMGKVLLHRKSGKPIAFYQAFLNRGTIFSTTRKLVAQMRASQ